MEIAATDGVDLVHDHTFAGALNAHGYRALGLPTVVTVHGPIDRDLYPYYRELSYDVSLIAISDRQRELAPDLNWVGRVHNGLRIDDWPFRRKRTTTHCSWAGSPRTRARIWRCGPRTRPTSRW